MILDVTYCIFGIDDLLFGAIIMAVASIGSTIASGVSNKRSRESQATINQANLDQQKEINQQNIDLQKSAVPDKFNQLTSLGMSRQAALQAVSGASYSPSAVATTQQAYQEQPLDFSSFGTLANLMQASAGLTEQKRVNDAELKLKEEALKQSRIDTWEKEYGKASKEVRDKVVSWIFNPENKVTAGDLQNVFSLMKSMPDDLREEASKYNIPSVVISDMIHDYMQSNFEQLNLGILTSEQDIKKIQAEIAEYERQFAEVKNNIDAENYPVLAQLNIDLLASQAREADANAKYADMLAKAGLTQEQAAAAKAELDGEFYQDHPKLYKAVRWLSMLLSPAAQFLGGASQGVATAAAFKHMNKPGRPGKK